MEFCCIISCASAVADLRHLAPTQARRKELAVRRVQEDNAEDRLRILRRPAWLEAMDHGRVGTVHGGDLVDFDANMDLRNICEVIR